ncbi:MAG TPA: hypothetical protein VK788_19030 [Terriglobales bacterium]|jgi:hypothetical protein|nr:hypothetical protein [Terriglobales bacterium]
MKVCGKDIKIQGRVVRIARLAHEGFEFLEAPEAALEYIREVRTGIDLFTFTQRLPHTTPQHSFPMEWDNVAALPVSTCEHWWKQQIDGKTRNMARRAEKKGIVVREVPFDDSLAKGIWEIYNECPVRQGRLFPHYGKDLDTVHKMSATFMETSIFIGAFLGEQLIGFVKLTSNETRSQATVMHIIAMVQHRDKAPTNALIAEAVRSCAKHGIPYLVYSNFSYGKKQRDSLSDFKENNGFRRIEIPRYYVPLTGLGRLALRLGLHHSLLDHVPESALAKLREFRNSWYNRKFRSIAEGAPKIETT